VSDCPGSGGPPVPILTTGGHQLPDIRSHTAPTPVPALTRRSRSHTRSPTKVLAGFDAVFHAADIEIITTPPQAPRANALCELGCPEHSGQWT